MACVVCARAEGNPSTSRQSAIVPVRYGPDRERFQIPTFTCAHIPVGDAVTDPE